MLISKTAYRASLFGGSCDYESFYSQYGAYLIGFAFNKYCYVSLNHTEHLTNIDFQAYYSTVEKVVKISDLQNPGIRGPLDFINGKHRLKNLAVYVQNELPSQTGIGSSSSLIVGLLNNLYKYIGVVRTKKQLAQDAIYIERVLNNEPGGIQDQILCAYGGLVSIEIDKSGEFYVKPLPVSEDFVAELENWSVMFYTNNKRQSYEIAKSHDNKSSEQYKLQILELAEEMAGCFIEGNLIEIGKGLTRAWDMKRMISSSISNSSLDDMYSFIMSNGALGCKLLGSGGSGFFYTIVPPNKKQQLIDKVGLPYIEPKVDYNGSKIIFDSDVAI